MAIDAPFWPWTTLNLYDTMIHFIRCLNPSLDAVFGSPNRIFKDFWRQTLVWMTKYSSFLVNPVSFVSSHQSGLISTQVKLGLKNNNAKLAARTEFALSKKSVYFNLAEIFASKLVHMVWFTTYWHHLNVLLSMLSYIPVYLKMRRLVYLKILETWRFVNFSWTYTKLTNLSIIYAVSMILEVDCNKNSSTANFAAAFPLESTMLMVSVQAERFWPAVNETISAEIVRIRILGQVEAGSREIVKFVFGPIAVVPSVQFIVANHWGRKTLPSPFMELFRISWALHAFIQAGKGSTLQRCQVTVGRLNRSDCRQVSLWFLLLYVHVKIDSGHNSE